MRGVIVLALLLVACSSEVIIPMDGDDGHNTVMGDDNVHDGDDGHAMDDHMGCQEDEVDVDGNCVPAQENNAQLFGQSLDQYVHSEEVTDPAGFYAEPIAEGDYPGVIIVHEWWGLNDNIKEMAKLLAKEGYRVFAIDLYGEVATTSDRAGQLAGAVRGDPDTAVAKMRNAVQFLRTQGSTEIGSMGWCFGGQQSLLISLNEEIDATVIYYGHLIDDEEQLLNLHGPVLGIFGEEDGGIPPEDVRSFEAALNNIGVENDIYIYDGVGHAFANPSGSNYAAEETVDAWEKTVAFLGRNLG